MKDHEQIIRDCQLALLWRHPFTGWPQTNLKGLLKITSRIALETTHYQTDFRHWKRLAHLGCVRPSGNTSPRDIFGTIEYVAAGDGVHPIIGIIKLFIKKTLVPKSVPQQEETLHSLTRHLRVTSWNVTSIKGQDARREKSHKFKGFLDKGVVMLQETKIPDTTHGLGTHLPMTEFRCMEAVEGRNAGESGGLLWMFPQNGGYSDISPPVELVRGLLGYVKAKYMGITIMFVNVYAPPDRRRSKVLSELSELLGDDTSQGDFIILGGDLNLDPGRNDDKVAWEHLETETLQNGLQRAPTHGHTYSSPAHGGTTLDHFFYTAMEEGNMRLDAKGRVLWTPQKGQHSPIEIVVSVSAKGGHKVGKQHRAIPPSVFETPSPERDHIVRSLVRYADSQGLGVARVIAYDPQADPDQKMHLAEEVVDRATLGTEPVGMFLHMEGMIRDWYRHLGHRRELDCTEVIQNALDADPNAEKVELPRSAVDTAQVRYDLELTYEANGNRAVLERSVAEAVVKAIAGIKVKATTNNRTSGIKRRFARYRKALTAKDQQFNVVELPDGRVTSDMQEIAKDRANTNAFQTRPPAVDHQRQIDCIRFYQSQSHDGDDIDAAIPSLAEIIQEVVACPDTSPGKGGVPYAAWRMVCLVTSMLLRAIFVQFLLRPGATLRNCHTREQVSTWIPKQTSSMRTEDMRELGLSTAFYRLLNRNLRKAMMKYVAPRMQKSQILMHKEIDILEAADYAQRYLDDSLPDEALATCQNVGGEVQRAALELIRGRSAPRSWEAIQDIDDLKLQNFGDLRQAFSQIDPKFVWMVMMALGTSAWLVAGMGLSLYDRVSWQKVGGRLLQPTRVQVGADMGNPMADIAFQLSIDPLMLIIASLPGVQKAYGYMDDIAASASLRGSIFFHKAMAYYERVGPIKIKYHQCFGYQGRLGPSAIALVGDHGTAPHEYVTHESGDTLVCTEALSEDDGRQRSSRRIPRGQMRILPHSVLPCNCKVKFATVMSRPISDEERALMHFLHSGPQVVTSAAEYLGIWTHEGSTDPDEDTRNDASFAKALGKLSRKCTQLGDTHRPITEKVNIWESLMITLFSYVGSLLEPSTKVIRTITKQLYGFIGFQWWASLEEFRGACIEAKVRRRITDPTTYMHKAAAGWTARKYRGTLTYANNTDRDELIRSRIEHSAELVQGIKGHRYATEAKTAYDAMQYHQTLNTKTVGHIIGAAEEIKILRRTPHSDKWRSNGWPEQTGADKALEALGNAEADDYTKISCIRWLWAGFVFSGKPRRFKRTRACQKKGCNQKACKSIGDGIPDLCPHHLGEMWQAAGGKLWNVGPRRDVLEHFGNIGVLRDEEIQEIMLQGIASGNYQRECNHMLEATAITSTEKGTHCCLCGFENGSHLHTLLACPTFGVLHQIIFGSPFRWDEVGTDEQYGPSSLIKAVHIHTSENRDRVCGNERQDIVRQIKLLANTWWHGLHAKAQPLHIIEKLRRMGAMQSQKPRTHANETKLRRPPMGLPSSSKTCPATQTRESEEKM